MIPTELAIMEHMPLPSTSIDLGIIVPCLAIQSYQGPFASYLHQKNLTNAHILMPEKHDLPREQAMSHFQTWLFFGTLRELALDNRVDDTTMPELQQLFVLPENADSTLGRISTKHLSAYWAGIDAQVQASSQDEQDSYRRRLISVLELSNQLVSDIDQNVMGAPHRAVVLSVILLNEFIMDSANLGEMDMDRPYVRSLLVESIMRERRWCLSDITRLSLDLDVTTLVFAALCGAPQCRKDHGGCSRLVCEARQILPTEEYEPRHAAGGACTCEHIPVNRDVVLESLNNEVIPVCRFYCDSEIGRLETIPASQVSRYVAISHVWSDRLGNRTANALPRCLLKNLQDMVDRLYPDASDHIAFWIDTLSCPVEPESATNQAIALMRETYADAEKVLVLDSYLEGVNYEGMAAFECALRIAYTGWTRRLWTLQEGVLAKQILFQFADAAIDGDALFMHLWQPPASYRMMPVLHAWMEIRSNWNVQPAVPNSKGDFVWMLYRALRFRSTSVATDEPLCLSTLTGVDLKEIVKVEKENRMKRFWQLYDKLDTTLLYWDGPRLDEPGLAWAPASLLTTSPEAFLPYHYNLITNSEEVTRTNDGIVFPSEAILLGNWKAPIAKEFWLRCEDDKWYHVTLTRRVGPPRPMGEASEGHTESQPPHPILALLMPTSLEQAFKDISRWPAQFPTAVLISIYCMDPDLVSGRFEGIGLIRSIDHADNDTVPPFWVPTLADTIETFMNREAAATEDGAASEVLVGQSIPTAAEPGGDRHTPESHEAQASELTEYFARVPEISVADGRLSSFIMSGEHVMFRGHTLSCPARFCLG